ncbi:uncharacterized protein C24B11.05-like isoform X2 [Diospyros lotus]|uniref:uncharacterized protein C24B11.05-like isoform X2 n=1 Tax=Diospyros lotus TaxID=55363 RepID=UPI002257DC9A|nr:uncharacterized protein C24B11.05-like isoform X2 [Diospyros lotus]
MLNYTMVMEPQWLVYCSVFQAIGYDLDYDDYHSYVHGRLPYDDILKPDPVLKYLLQSLPIRKVIFSNANKEHVDQVLGRLGLKECFDQVICFETLNPINKRNRIGEEDESNPSTILGTNTNFVNESSEHNTVPPKPLVACKPSEVSFELALKTAQINPKKTLFFDDSIRNLQIGKLMGLQTVWVGSSHRTKGVDHALKSIHNMKEALPDLWEAIEKTEDAHYTEQVAIQTSVRA